MRSAWWLAAFLAGCGEAAPEAACDAADAPTWDNFARGYVQTWCTPCHTANLTGEVARQGAPEGVNFDTYAQVAADAALVRAWATGERPPMPPAGGTDPDEVARLDRWLACGAPGADPDPGVCDAPAALGQDVTLPDQAAADRLCEAGDQTVASLDVRGPVALGCVCAVEGDLTIRAGQAQLDNLASVGGDLAITGSARAAALPQLLTVGGDLTVDAVALTGLDLRTLDRVEGGLTLYDTRELSRVELIGLQHAGRVDVRDLPDLRLLRLSRLRTVAGDLEVRRLPLLEALADTNAVVEIGGDLVLEELGVATYDHWTFSFLETIGGDLRIVGHPRIEDIGGFTLLGDPTRVPPEVSAVGGDVIIEGNDGLRGIKGFDNLRWLPGDLVLRDHRDMERILGFHNLGEVHGSLVLDGAPDLAGIDGLQALTRVQGDLRLLGLGELQALGVFPELAAVGGSLEIRDNAEVDALEGWAELTTIGADLRVLGNPELDDLAGLYALTRVEGDVVVRDNGSLDPSTVEAWLTALGAKAVGGEVVVEANGEE